MSLKTFGLLTIYRQGSDERHYFGSPDAHRDALATSWGWSILRTEAVSKADYEALSAERDQLKAEAEALRMLAAECNDYLNFNELTNIAHGSILHRKLADTAMAAKEG